MNNTTKTFDLGDCELLSKPSKARM
ncbi:hypothetical protein BVRB_037970, partial [Beta vulgaris subsp. vulgaris]